MLKPSVPSVLKAYNENTICEAGKTIILTYARLKGDTDSVDASAGFGVGREEREGGGTSISASAVPYHKVKIVMMVVKGRLLLPLF